MGPSFSSSSLIWETHWITLVHVSEHFFFTKRKMPRVLSARSLSYSLRMTSAMPAQVGIILKAVPNILVNLLRCRRDLKHCTSLQKASRRQIAQLIAKTLTSVSFFAKARVLTSFTSFFFMHNLLKKQRAGCYTDVPLFYTVCLLHLVQ